MMNPPTEGYLEEPRIGYLRDEAVVGPLFERPSFASFLRWINERRSLDNPVHKLKILVVDDHPLFLQGIATVISAHADMEVVAQAKNGLEAVELYRTHEPDVAIMDLRMPNLGGVDAISIIVSEYPAARILVMTTYQGDAEALRALKAGARGYLLKSAIPDDVPIAIRRVAQGFKYVPPEIASALADHAAEGSLSTREIEVLGLIAMGHSNLAAANALSISEETIKSHMKSIIAKLAARDRTHAVMIAVRRGILTDYQ